MGRLDSDTLLPNEMRATDNMFEFDYENTICKEVIFEEDFGHRKVKETARIYYATPILSPAAKAVIDRNGLGEFTLRWNNGEHWVIITAPDKTSATLFRLAF